MFLWAVLTPPSVFNMLPFAIHEAISPAGNSEQAFIIAFDLLFALLLFIGSSWLGKKYYVNKIGIVGRPC
jgi:hypothetical protein